MSSAIFLIQALQATGSGVGLLIVDVLLGGPATEQELELALPDVGTHDRASILGSPLDAGIVRRAATSDSHDAAYELTELGLAAAPVVETLKAWGASMPD